MSRRNFMSNGLKTDSGHSSASASMSVSSNMSSTGGSTSITNNQSQLFAQQNKHLSKMLENEKQEKRRLETKVCTACEVMIVEVQDVLKRVCKGYVL